MRRTATLALRLPRLHIFIYAALLLPLQAWAMDLARDDVQQFISELTTKEGFDTAYVESVLADSETQQSIITAMTRPAEKAKPWHEYRAIFITPERIAAGVEFYATHRETLDRISTSTGVSQAMILGIIGVESYFGRTTGNYRVVDALVTLGFDYPPRADFFRSELNQAFLLAREEQLNLLDLKGSYAGAMGPPQFIASSYRNFAVDGDGDGRRDLLNNWVDIMASVANYFVVHKWQTGQQVAVRATISKEAGILPLNVELLPESTVMGLNTAGVVFPTELPPAAPAGLWQLQGKDDTEYWVGFQNLYVITRYNRSIMYALAAWQLGEAIVGEVAE
jgi:membrane-bound lytic murein transglycosylase B